MPSMWANVKEIDQMERIARFIGWIGVMILVTWGFHLAGISGLLLIAALLIIGAVSFIVIVLG